MIGSILLGVVLTLVTIGIHAVGTAWWIGRLKLRAKRVRGSKIKLLPLRLLCSTALLLLLLHMAEVAPWASAYLFLPGLDSINSFEQATYFATVTFASLGYGDIVIEGPWRLLSAVQAMNGLLVFGWSTALLFAVVERIWGADDNASEDETTAPQILEITSDPQEPLKKAM